MSVRIATAVSWCVGCYQQQPQARHVEWDTSFDGGARVNDDQYPIETQDSCCLCENCIRNAVELLDVSPSVLIEKDREIEGLKRDLAKANEYADKLEDAIPRRPGRPRKAIAA